MSDRLTSAKRPANTPEKTMRRCAVSGEVLPRRALVRFVHDPQGWLVPDIGVRLPGRGVWVRADRASFRHALAKNVFARALARPLKIPDKLEAGLENLLARKVCELLGMARKAGWLVSGFEATRQTITQARPALLIIARDGAEDGRIKLFRLWKKTHPDDPSVLSCLSSGELGMALGRERVIYGAVKSCPLAARIRDEAMRLGGFRDNCDSTAIKSRS